MPSTISSTTLGSRSDGRDAAKTGAMHAMTATTSTVPNEMPVLSGVRATLAAKPTPTACMPTSMRRLTPA